MAFDSILIVGCGNMAGAMLEGWLAGGFSPHQFLVVDPAGTSLPKGVAKRSALVGNERCDAILLGVKPQLLGEVARDVAPRAGPESVVISILAGVELASLEAHFPNAGAYLRVMPNLAAALGKSPLALAERGLGAQGRRAAIELMKPLGTPEWIDEAHFDLITALAGSGPAFVYRFIDVLGTAAADLGLPAETAHRLALAMVEGAVALAAGSKEPPAELARRVTSPGGTTQAGLEKLDEGDSLRLLLEKTLRAARDRSAELAAEARRKG